PSSTGRSTASTVRPSSAVTCRTRRASACGGATSTSVLKAWFWPMPAPSPPVPDDGSPAGSRRGPHTAQNTAPAPRTASPGPGAAGGGLRGRHQHFGAQGVVLADAGPFAAGAGRRLPGRQQSGAQHGQEHGACAQDREPGGGEVEQPEGGVAASGQGRVDEQI